MLTGSHVCRLRSQSSEVCGLRECCLCCFPDLVPHPWNGCGAQGPPHVAENEGSHLSDVPAEENTLLKARGEERQGKYSRHHVLQHGHLEKPGPEYQPSTCWKQAPSLPKEAS